MEEKKKASVREIVATKKDIQVQKQLADLRGRNKELAKNIDLIKADLMSLNQQKQTVFECCSHIQQLMIKCDVMNKHIDEKLGLN